jgi:hypothetical protein
MIIGGEVMAGWGLDVGWLAGGPVGGPDQLGCR